MVYSCNKKNCPLRRRSISMRGGSCGCNNKYSSFSGGKRSNKRKRSIGKRRNCSRKIRGGSAGLSSLSSTAYYPQNNYISDMSDPSKQIAGRFTDVPRISPTFGGKKRKTLKNGKKMQGGSGFLHSQHFLGSFGNSSEINNASGTWLGANSMNPPSYLQSAASPYTDNTYSGYNSQNPYLV